MDEPRTPNLLDAYYRARATQARAIHKRSFVNTYDHLCQIERNTVSLENVPGTDYYPAFYTEELCKSNLNSVEERGEATSNSIQTCGQGAYHCIQQESTIYLLKKTTDPTCLDSSIHDSCPEERCWQFERRTVPSGCECMWPTASLGERR